MRITIVTPSLAAGGAERSVVLLSAGFLNKSHNVSVVTLYPAATDAYALPEGAARIALDIAADSPTVIHGFFRNLKRLATLRKAVRTTRPDVVISNMTQTNVLTTIALTGTSHPVVMIEHSNPTMNAGNGIWRLLRRAVYPRAAQLVSVSRDINDYFRWLPESKKAVIPNPLSISAYEISANKDSFLLDANKKWIAAMGRLIHVKGFDRLLAAFAKLAAKHPRWHLVIMGAGELRSDLAQLIERLGLKGRVQLAGFVSNPFGVFRHSEFFVMSSRSEGFPYALLEAMSCALPAIAMECTSGPREIIRDGLDGILVREGDVEALAGAMDRLMSDTTERKLLAARAPDVLERFGLEKTIEQWERLFAGIVQDKR